MAESSSYDRVVELLNQASLEHSGASKVILLKQVQELIINKEPNLLDNFFDEVLGFQSDKSVDVRKFVISFLEYACKVDGEILSKIIGNLNILLFDENVNIKKKVMLSMASLYRTALKWIVDSKIITEVMEETWKYLSQMKDHIVKLLDDDNDGIRTHSVKFCEGVVSALTPKTADSSARDDDQSLDIVPEGEGFLQKDKLHEDGQKTFKLMLEFLCSQSITSVNLMACMTSMTSLARRRPQYMTQVIGGFESLHVNLPPTLSKSQVSSVRKSLKMQMLALLKHQSASDMIPQIATLLTDLGATQTEVNKAMPRPSELAANRKRKAESEAEKQRNKKLAKTEMPALPVLADIEDDDDDGDMSAPKAKDVQKPLNPVEITTDDIIPKLTSSNVADLVLLSMVMLPDEMPAHFQSTYTPIAAAGTPGQIKHISRLLAVQLTSVGVGKGIEEQRLQEKEKEKAKEEAEPSSSSIQVVGEQSQTPTQTKAQFTVPLSGTSTRKTKAYGLESVTKPLSVPLAANLVTMCMQRIFKAEGEANKANLSAAFCKMVSGLTTQFGGYFKEMLYDFILADIRNRAELALAWVYSEYVAFQGFTLAEGIAKPSQHGYEECLISLLQGLYERRDQPGSPQLFIRLLLESPQLPPSAVGILKLYCTSEKQVDMGMQTVRQLMLYRPNLLNHGLYTLLDFTYHEKPQVRNTAIEIVIKDLYDHPRLTHLIDEFCKTMVNHLLAPAPTFSMFPSTPKFKFDGVKGWNEIFIKQTMYLYLNIFPDKPSYIELLAEVYVKSVADVKRVILRLMEAPIKQLGMNSPELLQFIRTSPKGSETLITRIIHILTERQAPSSELVSIVKHLYQERVTDIRFLIPVLGGLGKEEVIAALPKLINLAPAIVKEVFNRLLGVGGQTGQDAAVTPSELMVALHNITPAQCEIKAIIKATTMCFQEKALFTQEILAIVINQLMEVLPLPTLFMRTVIQAFTMHPKLLGFVINILQRLIVKQVWKDKKAWEGFVRCCQRARPQSLHVLLQLPPTQLAMSFTISPELRQSLLKLVSGYNTQQKSMLQKGVLAVIEQPTVKAEVKQEVAIQKTPVKEGLPEKSITARDASSVVVETISTSTSVTDSTSTAPTAALGDDPLPPGVHLQVKEDSHSLVSADQSADLSTESADTIATPGDVIATPADTIATPADTVATPAATTATPADTVATPAATIATPAATILTPAATIATPAATIATPADSIATPADTIATPAATIATPADSIATPAATIATPADTIATSAATIVTPAATIATTSDTIATSVVTIAKSADSIATTADTIATSVVTIATSADSIATTADTIATSVVTIATSADTIATSVVTIATSADSIATTADTIATSVVTIATSADSIATPADTLTKSEETPVKPAISISESNSVDGQTDTTATNNLEDEKSVSQQEEHKSEESSSVMVESIDTGEQVLDGSTKPEDTIKEQPVDDVIRETPTAADTVTPESSPAKSPSKRGRKRAATTADTATAPTTRKSARRKK